MTERTYPFTGQYVDVSQLRPEGQKGVYVHQGYAAISKDGSVLESEGFSMCSALVIQNADSNEAFLAHISEWDLSARQYPVLGDLSPGKYKGIFVVGTLSRVGSRVMVDPKITNFMQFFASNGRRELTVVDDMYVESGSHHWSVSYDPVTRAIKVITNREHQITELTLT